MTEQITSPPDAAHAERLQQPLTPEEAKRLNDFGDWGAVKPFRTQRHGERGGLLNAQAIISVHNLVRLQNNAGIDQDSVREKVEFYFPDNERPDNKYGAEQFDAAREAFVAALTESDEAFQHRQLGWIDAHERFGIDQKTGKKVDELRGQYGYSDPEYPNDDLDAVLKRQAEAAMDNLAGEFAKRSKRFLELTSAKKIRAAQGEFDDMLSAFATELYESEIIDGGRSHLEAQQVVDSFIIAQTSSMLEAMEQKRIERVVGKFPVLSESKIGKWMIGIRDKAVEKWKSWDVEPDYKGFGLVERLREQGWWQHLETKADEGTTRRARLGRLALAGIVGVTHGIDNLKHKNTLKKMGVMGALGVPVGAIGGLLGGVLAAGGAGAFIGGALARSSVRTAATLGLNNAANAEAVAGADRQKMQSKIDEITASGEYSVEELLREVNNATEKMIVMNDVKLLGGIAIGLTSAVVGHEITQGLIGLAGNAVHPTGPEAQGSGAASDSASPKESSLPSGGASSAEVSPAPSSSASGGGQVVAPESPHASEGTPPSGNGSTATPESPGTSQSTPNSQGSDIPTGNGQVATPEGTAGSGTRGGTEISSEAMGKYIENHPKASNIRDGGGWYETMEELGVKAGDRPALLSEVGEELHDIKIEVGDRKIPLAYFDTEHREWRINMPTDHKMPREALETIIKQAQEQDYLKHPIRGVQTDSDIPTGNGKVATPESTVGTKTVKLWHGAATEHVLQKTYPGLSNREAFLSINDLYDKFGGKGVFEVKGSNGKWVPLELAEHDKNNIWIMRDSGRVRLTSDAQNYLDKTYHNESSISGGHSDVPTGNGKVATPESPSAGTGATANQSGDIPATGNGKVATLEGSRVNQEVIPNDKFSDVPTGNGRVVAPDVPRVNEGSSSSDSYVDATGNGNVAEAGAPKATTTAEKAVGTGRVAMPESTGEAMGIKMSRDETVTEFVGAMNERGLVNISTRDMRQYATVVGAKLGTMSLDNGSPAAYYDRFSRTWRLNGVLTDAQIDTIISSIDTKMLSRVAA